MKVITTNRKAYYEYHVLDKLEAGIILVGSEVKSLRNNKGNLEGSYVYVENGEVTLVGCHIDEYKFANGDWSGHHPRRIRKLLLNRSEIKKFAEKSTQQGFTIVPLQMYFNDNGIAKVEIAVVKGKKLHDKRTTLKEKQLERDCRE